MKAMESHRERYLETHLNHMLSEHGIPHWHSTIINGYYFFLLKDQGWRMAAELLILAAQVLDEK